MLRRSLFVFGGNQFGATVSARAWTPADFTVGGSRTAASGTPASYVIRRDALLEITVRFYESEWLALLNLIAHGQASGVITWYPEVDDDTVSWPVYLEAPLAGERFAPTRDANYPRVMELPLTLRGVGTAVPWLEYFAAG